MSVLSACINAYIEGKKVVFFGAGAEGSVSLIKLCNAASLVSYYVDNAPGRQGKKMHDLPIYTPNKLMKENRDELRVIITAVDYRGPSKQLFEMGFHDVYASTFNNATEKILQANITNVIEAIQGIEQITDSNVFEVTNLLTDEMSKEVFTSIVKKRKQGNLDYSDIYTMEPMYFNDIFRNTLSHDEVYVDAGVHNFDTIIDFIFYVSGKFKKIYAFEPDIENNARLSKDIGNIKNVILYNCGLSNENGEVHFNHTGHGLSGIVSDLSKSTDKTKKIKVVKLDSFLKEPVSIIKMDIEGSEYDALLGASETIIKHKPKLAISLYHRPDDLIRIPKLIYEMVPEYKLFLRHHRADPMETILYAKI